MQTGLDFGRRKKGSAFYLFGLAFLVAFAFGMCIRTGQPELISPMRVAQNMLLWIRLSIGDLLGQPISLQRQQLVENAPYYLETIARFRNLLMTIICGAAIAVGGVVFQIVFQNPMAAPNMLGTGSGISFGLLILVLQYTTNAYSMIVRRYVYCLGFAFLMLIIVLLMGKFAGKNRTGVTDMLLCGGLLSQVIGTISMYIRFNMDQDTLIILQDLSLYGFSMNTSYDDAFLTLMILIGLALLCIMPVFLMRYSFDAISFGNEESRALGVNISVVRVVCIIAVTMLVTTATLYCGNIGVLSLAVPHICRHFTGSRFRDVLAGSIFFGAFLLLICRDITSLIYLKGMGFFPIATMMGMLIAPILALVLMRNGRGMR